VVTDSSLRPWRPLTPDEVAQMPGQLGVYELADDTGQVLRIAYVGGHEDFGLRSALTRELSAAIGATQFRVEFTHGYMTRWQELLMLHRAHHGSLPPGNAGITTPIGRLSPGEVR